jgi:hypothetical protein
MNIGNWFSVSTSNIKGHRASTIAGGAITLLGGATALLTGAAQTWVQAGMPMTAEGAAVAVAPFLIGALLGPKKE